MQHKALQGSGGSDRRDPFLYVLACMMQQEAPKASGQSLAERVRSQLTGVKTVLVSAPGVLLEESSPEQLQVHPCLLSSAITMAARTMADTWREQTLCKCAPWCSTLPKLPDHHAKIRRSRLIGRMLCLCTAYCRAPQNNLLMRRSQQRSGQQQQRC